MPLAAYYRWLHPEAADSGGEYGPEWRVGRPLAEGRVESRGARGSGDCGVEGSVGVESRVRIHWRARSAPSVPSPPAPGGLMATAHPARCRQCCTCSRVRSTQPVKRTAHPCPAAPPRGWWRRRWYWSCCRSSRRTPASCWECRLQVVVSSSRSATQQL